MASGRDASAAALTHRIAPGTDPAHPRRPGTERDTLNDGLLDRAGFGEARPRLCSQHLMPLWTSAVPESMGPAPRLVNVSSVRAIDVGGVESCAVQGRTVAFRQFGAGPVVVLVHGLAGTMGTWDPVLEGLSARCTVVAVDLPGHGRSAPPAGDYSLEANADCLRDLLDALGHRAATVVGHSLGGGVAMQFAYQYPERCERLVLVSSGGLALMSASRCGPPHCLAVSAWSR